jgi:NAD(P)-dependent dehydrogenase (short-subunit alcohol dehydrogenase family)
MRSELDFTGKVALVTGGARGVGAGISRVLLAAGALVVTCGRHEPDGSEPGSLPEGAGRRAEFLLADVRDADQAQALVAQIADRHGRLDVLVNNAGGAPFAPAAEASAHLHEQVVALNLLAPLHVAQAANAVMQSQSDGGSIVNITSVSGRRASPGTAAYGAAKAGLENLTRTLAVEWAPKVRVNALVVGPVLTEQAHLHYGDEAGIDAVARTIALGRLAEPEDVGHCCLFLSSPLASYVTGAALLLDGGGERPAFLDAANVNRDRPTR